MAKPGRNDPCPCGSGNKYKKCCLAKEEAVAREQLVKAQAPRDALRRDQRAAANRLQVTELTAAVAARLARAEEEDAYEDALDIASNAVVDLVRAAKLDEAEAAARDLLRRFPDVHDRWDRLGMVHEARGDSRQAADCYRDRMDGRRERTSLYYNKGRLYIAQATVLPARGDKDMTTPSRYDQTIRFPPDGRFD
jgi:tetratricopeptide (TPR) repeat protein